MKGARLSCETKPRAWSSDVMDMNRGVIYRGIRVGWVVCSFLSSSFFSCGFFWCFLFARLGLFASSFSFCVLITCISLLHVTSASPLASINQSR